MLDGVPTLGSFKLDSLLDLFLLFEACLLLELCLFDFPLFIKFLLLLHLLELIDLLSSLILHSLLLSQECILVLLPLSGGESSHLAQRSLIRLPTDWQDACILQKFNLGVLGVLLSHDVEERLGIYQEVVDTF